jgi:FkbM family methyltransferase
MQSFKNQIKQLAFQTYQKLSPEGFPSGLDLSYDLKRILDGNPLQTIFDVGANVGQTALYFNKHFPKVNIYSFEPVKKTFDTLKSNVGHLHNVQIFQYALGSKNEKISIYLTDDPNSQTNSLIAREGKTRTELIEVQTLDSFCHAQNIDTIDMLKTDTEGFDLEVLKGAIQKIQDRKIKFILSEATFYLPDRSHTQFSPLLEFLFPLGFRFYHMYETCYDANLAKGIMYTNALFVNEKLLSNR